ncbi:kinase [Trichoderma arundinaceum]|uniref:Kinase n=1 Tax=Trichoderma arundinaceum TaxID=490622 RepID=A0A395NC86_TRIAR|nr:kinase [Trichoderma arundinaceum]
MFQKVALVQRMAELQAQISRHEFSKIGTLVVGNDDGSHGEQPGEVVSNMFFWGSHFDYDIARGPYRSSHDWLAAYLDFVIQDQMAALEKAEHEEDEEDINFALSLARRLVSLLPKIFPSLQNPPERTVVWHEDLSLSNILVDEHGRITAVIDWECISAMPRWVATKAPKFLEGPSREKEPKRQEYNDESARGSEESEDSQDDELDNEGKDELYWIHLMEYEKTQLRKFYYARMCHYSRTGAPQLKRVR